jgi:hypothetical protein
MGTANASHLHPSYQCEAVADGFSSDQELRISCMSHNGQSDLEVFRRPIGLCGALTKARTGERPSATARLATV